jgi:single-stranded-DNA-specific exonuclease
MDTPYFALQLLLNENGKAHEFAQKLEEFNGHRQNRVEVIMEEAEKKLIETGQIDAKVILMADPNWSAGVIGLIAARLSEKYHRPAIIGEDRGEDIVASCRSPQYFNIFDALQVHHDRFKTYGGHSAAAGFSISKEQWGTFFEEMHRYADEQIQSEGLIRCLEVDYSIELEDLTWDLGEKLKLLQPYGMANPKPRFLIKGAQIRDIQTVGREHRHLKFRLNSPKNPMQAIAFQFGKYFKELCEHVNGKKTFDIVFELEKTRWMDRERLEMKVVDLSPAA